MKSHFLLPILAFAPVAASAQTKVVSKAPQISIQPAAEALINRAKIAYRKLDGFSFEVAKNFGGQEEERDSVSFRQPNLLRLRARGGAYESVVGDGKNFYFVYGNTYSQFPATTKELPLTLEAFSRGGLTCSMVGQMLSGQSPLDEFLHSLLDNNTKAPFPVSNFRYSAKALPAQVVDGALSRGVKTRNSYDAPDGQGKIIHVLDERTLWFGADSFLRRIDGRGVQKGQADFVYNERVLNQKLNPTFPSDTWKFDATGLELSPN